MRGSWGLVIAPVSGLRALAIPGHHSFFTRTLQIPAQSDPVRLQKLPAPDSGIVELRLDLPQVKNAINWDLMRRQQDAIEKIEVDAAAKVILVASSVPGVLSAGADLKALSIPTIAVIEGAALGGGLELALSCDLRICGKNASLRLPETGLAIILGAGGTQRLPMIIGRSRAKELIFTCRRCDGTEAVVMGLAKYCVPTEGAYEKALELARNNTESSFGSKNGQKGH